jgi:hypothetical protein
MGRENPNYKSGQRCRQNKVNERMKKLTEIRMLNLLKEAKKTYLNQSWMFNEYCIKGTSVDEIAKKCKVEYDVIWFGLKDLGIPRIIIVGRKKWHEWVEKHKNIKPLEYKGL